MHTYTQYERIHAGNAFTHEYTFGLTLRNAKCECSIFSSFIDIYKVIREKQKSLFAYCIALQTENCV